MTDQEAADVIRRVLHNDDYVHLDDEKAAYRRAIELLEAKPIDKWMRTAGVTMNTNLPKPKKQS